MHVSVEKHHREKNSNYLWKLKTVIKFFKDRYLTLDGVFKKFLTKSKAWLCCGSTDVFYTNKE